MSLKQVQADNSASDKCIYHLHREAISHNVIIHLLPADMAARLENALAEAEARERDSRLQQPLTKGSFQEWEYDIAVADSGFHSDIKAAIELPLKSLNVELQVK